MYEGHIADILGTTRNLRSTMTTGMYEAVVGKVAGYTEPLKTAISRE